MGDYNVGPERPLGKAERGVDLVKVKAAVVQSVVQ